MKVYYNENDRQIAKWLREIINEGILPDGDIDTRSIEDVKPTELIGYDRCHFFAGIGGWEYALQLAGWPEDLPVWTGSCPCQPFSTAGRRTGVDDERHLWPMWRWLIDQVRPSTIFGEQVASKDGREWYAGVRFDLDRMGYQVGASDLPAAGAGAPHIRQRLWWVAESSSLRGQENLGNISTERKKHRTSGSINSSEASHDRLAHLFRIGWRRGSQESNVRKIQKCRGSEVQIERSGDGVGMAESSKQGFQGSKRFPEYQNKNRTRETSTHGTTSQCNNDSSFWSNSIWHHCQDGKTRRIPIEPEIFPLANGIPNRILILRGAGNSIVPQVAAEFIKAFMEVKGL